MSIRLNKSEFVPYAPEERGAQINMHHCKMGKGNDKLYIRRLEDGNIVAYCHHCHGSGYARSTSVTNFKTREKTGLNNSGTVVDDGQAQSYREHIREEYCKALPFEYTHDRQSYESSRPAWAIKAKLTYEMVCDSNAKIIEGRIWFPLFDGGTITVLAGRAWGKDLEPKWLTFKYKSRVWDVLWEDIPTTNDLVIVCEDLLSCIRLKALGYNTMPLMGTGIPREQRAKLVEHFPRVIIWLDNDNAQVLTQRKKLRQGLTLFLNHVIVCTHDTQPKELSDDELIQIIEDLTNYK